MHVTIACLVTIDDFCFQAFVLVQHVTNDGVRSHGYEAKAKPHRTGSVGPAAVWSIPDGIHKYMDELNFNFQKY